MADMTADVRFATLFASVERLLETLHNAGMPDARSLTWRQRGWNFLQGHARAVIPLAVWFAMQRPQHLRPVREATTLSADSSADGRNRTVWRAVQDDLIDLL